MVRPSLTACARDVEAYGARAARALLDLLEGQSVPQSEEEPTSLVPRASTAVVPA
ncbi:MAG: substrate-binding domain-containing protein [Acidimicrobiales bacterium]